MTKNSNNTIDVTNAKIKNPKKSSDTKQAKAVNKTKKATKVSSTKKSTGKKNIDSTISKQQSNESKKETTLGNPVDNISTEINSTISPNLEADNGIEEEEMSRFDEFVQNLKTVFYAIFIALIIRSFLFEPFRIPSGSMYPTLKVGDYLFVNKFAYGYSRYSLPTGIPLIKGRIFYKQPKRGDIVVFKFPKNPQIDFIKRIIGLPGDKIQMINGRLYINGEVIQREEKEKYVIDEYVYIPEYYHFYEEKLDNEFIHNIIEISDDERIVDNTDVFEVPEDSFFVMGDNRDRSDDSRISVGFVPKDNLVGKASFIFFSHNDKGKFYAPWTWKDAIRWKRLFKGIH